MGKKENNFKIKLFGSLRDYFEEDVLEVTIYSEKVTIEILLEEIKIKYPKTSSILPSCLLSINNSFPESNQMINNNDSILLAPSIAGG